MSDKTIVQELAEAGELLNLAQASENEAKASLDLALATVEAKNAEIAGLNEKVSALESEKAAMVAELSEVKESLDAKNAELVAVAEQVEALKAKMSLKPFADVSEGAEAAPESGSEAGEGPKSFTRSQIAGMTKAEYSANRAEILKAYNEGRVK